MLSACCVNKAMEGNEKLPLCSTGMTVAYFLALASLVLGLPKNYSGA
jgi:hypothetical protein